METWQYVSLLLCVFGVLKEFRPSEPYVTKYLTNPPMNFTDEEVSDSIYPVSIYATMASLVIIFLLTDLLRYKPVIIFHTSCAFIVFVMLITVRSLILVQVLEVFYGLFMSSEVAYYAYIYAKVNKDHYQEVSGHTRAAYLVGRSVSGAVSQIYISLNPSSYYVLNYFSLGGMTFATLWAFFLPPVATSLYFARSESTGEDISPVGNNFLKMYKIKSRIKRSIRYLSKDFCHAFSTVYNIKWMVWWALASCGYYQVLSYVQVLWEDILKGDKYSTTLHSELNGIVETLYTLLSAAVAFGCGKVTVSWDTYGEFALCVCSLASALLLFLMSETTQILLAYATYILYTVFFNGMITIANSEIATHLNPESHGLIFGVNMFMALVFQSILTLVVNTYLNLSGRNQFLTYSCYFGILGFFFCVITIFKIVKHLNNCDKTS